MPAPQSRTATDLRKPLQIGSVSLPNRMMLAPMAGVADRPFRTLCRRLGAGLAVSEMVSANPALRASRKSRERGDHRGEPGPIAVQIAGADPAQMAAAARYNADRGADLIDINLGCPAKKVCRAAAGSALLRDEALVGRLLEAVVGAVEVPVTLKTRTGWSPQTRNLSRIAAIAREAGIALIAVHGRTRACGYRAAAEYDSLRRLRAETDLPLVANGDIDGPEKARWVLDHTGADAIMIGRAAQGRPWIFQGLGAAVPAHRDRDGAASGTTAWDRAAAASPPPAWVRDILLEHLEALYSFYGEARGVLIARKHIRWYLHEERRRGPHPGISGTRLQQAQTASEQSALVRAHFDGPAGEPSARRPAA